MTINKAYNIHEGQEGFTADFPNNPTVPETNNYLASNFFRFQLPRTSTVTYFVQAVSFPGIQLTPVEMPNRLGRPNQFIGGRFDHEPLTLQFAVDEDMLNYKEIFDWMKLIGNYQDDTNIVAGYQTAQFFCDATLVITNSAYREKQKVTFKNTYPIALSGLQFSSILTDSDVQLATVTLNFETYEFELI
tara:strand:- start:1208 stop:1774 length:567 start_codon:yes stop_codon:yes gene_type:complete